jgi:hypothetical protein
MTVLIFSTVAKLVAALKRSIPEGTQNADLKTEALRLGVNCSAGPSTKRLETARTWQGWLRFLCSSLIPLVAGNVGIAENSTQNIEADATPLLAMRIRHLHGR